MQLSLYDGSVWRTLTQPWVWTGLSWYRGLTVWVWDGSVWRQGYQGTLLDPTGLSIGNASSCNGTTPDYGAIGSWSNPRGYAAEVEWFVGGVSQGVISLGTGATSASRTTGSTRSSMYYKVRFVNGSLSSNWVQSGSYTPPLLDCSGGGP